MLPVEVLVAAQVLQFHSLDLVVIKVKLIQAVWKILQTQIHWKLVDFRMILGGKFLLFLMRS